MPPNKEATLVKRLRKGWRGEAALYKLTPRYEMFNCDIMEIINTEYVVISIIGQGHRRTALAIASDSRGNVDEVKGRFFVACGADVNEAYTLRSFGYAVKKVEKVKKQKPPEKKVREIRLED